MGRIGCVHCEKFRHTIVAMNFCINCTYLAHFEPRIIRKQSGPKCTQRVWNAPKQEFRVQWGWLDALVAKNSDATSWHELLHQFGPFCTEFCMSTKRSQMHQNCTNAPKHEFRVQWGGSGAFIVKNSVVTSARTFALIAPVQPVLYQASCR